MEKVCKECARGAEVTRVRVHAAIGVNDTRTFITRDVRRVFRRKTSPDESRNGTRICIGTSGGGLAALLVSQHAKNSLSGKLEKRPNRTELWDIFPRACYISRLSPRVYSQFENSDEN